MINHRKLPGEGDFPIRDYVRVFRELGYDGPWGVEVLSEELRNLPIDEIFDRAYESSDRAARRRLKGARVSEQRPRATTASSGCSRRCCGSASSRSA